MLYHSEIHNTNIIVPGDYPVIHPYKDINVIVGLAIGQLVLKTFKREHVQIVTISNQLLSKGKKHIFLPPGVYALWNTIDPHYSLIMTLIISYKTASIDVAIKSSY